MLGAELRYLSLWLAVFACILVPPAVADGIRTVAHRSVDVGFTFVLVLICLAFAKTAWIWMRIGRRQNQRVVARIAPIALPSFLFAWLAYEIIRSVVTYRATHTWPEGLESFLSLVAVTGFFGVTTCGEWRGRFTKAV